MLMQKQFTAILIILLTCFFSCKKAIEQKKQDLIVQAMTSGRWIIQNYTAGNTDVTAEFTGYEFQFYNNGTVDGIYNSSATSGTWAGNASQLTMSANFPNTGRPLSRLNGLWKITDNSWTYVNASLDTNRLKLIKK